MLKAGEWGALASIITTVALTITGELHAPLKNWLAATFSHHWLGKSIISIAVFFGVAFISYLLGHGGKMSEDSKITNLLKLLVSITLIATGLLIGFYLYEYFK